MFFAGLFVCRHKALDNPNQNTSILYVKNRERRVFMKASVAIQVLPDAESTEKLVYIVDKVIEYIASTGLNYFVGPFETTIEGDSYDELMETVKNCQKVALSAGCKSVSAYVKIRYNEDGVLTIDEKTSKHIH